MRPLIVIAAAVLVLAGCSGGDADPTAQATVTVTAGAPAAGTPTESATPTSEPDWDVAEEFATAVFNNDFGDARGLAAKGSPAARYVTHQAALYDALVAAGESEYGEVTVTVDEKTGTVDIVPTYSDGDGYTWQDWTFGPDGKIVSWSAKGAGPVEDRLWTKSTSDTVLGNKVTLVSAYQGDLGALWIVLDVAADQMLEPWSTAVLTDAKKRQREASSISAPDVIEPDTSAYVVLMFDGAKLGGTLTYTLDGGLDDEIGKARLKVS
jgi:hypothetical protein